MCNLQPDTIIVYPTAVNGRKIVAVIGWANDYAAYASPAEWTDERCASNGDKISADEAHRLFPNMRENYRE